MKNQPNFLTKAISPIACFIVNNNNVEYKVTSIQPYSVETTNDGRKVVADKSRYKKIDLVDESIMFNMNLSAFSLGTSPISKRNVLNSPDKKLQFCEANEFFLVTDEESEVKSETTYVLFAPAKEIGYVELANETEINEFTVEKSGEIQINVSSVAKGSSLLKKTILSYTFNPTHEIDEIKAKPYREIQTKLSDFGIALDLEQVYQIKTNLSEIFG
jgi:hypothetical protein